MPRTRNRWLAGLRLLAFFAAAGLFLAVIVTADLRRVSELVMCVGALGFALVLLPQMAAVAVESYGWKLAILALGRRVSLASLIRVRVGTEALAQSLPAGVVFAESVKPLLLGRHCGLRVDESLAAMVARKYLLLLSQAGYLLLVVTLGFGTLEAVSSKILGVAGLPWFAYAAGVALAAAAFGMGACLKQSSVACWLLQRLKRLPSGRLNAWLSGCERRFSDTDTAVSAFFRLGFLQKLGPLAGFFGGWLLESSESYLILRVLGADVSFIAVVSLEVLLTLVRHVVFIVPAGLGVQDLGYVTAFAALGMPDARSVGAAFVVLKRTKELVWIAAGYGLLALDGLEPAGTKRNARAWSARWIRGAAGTRS